MKILWNFLKIKYKAGVDSVTRSLAAEWGDYGIRVNGIAPGPIKDTEGLTRLSKGVSADELDKVISSRVPLGRMGTKEGKNYNFILL